MQTSMTMAQWLTIGAANLLPLGLVLSTIVLVIWARRRAAVKRAGVNAASPGCTKCLYLVRGWNSSLCPECGTDARIAGVCIGPRVHLALKLIAATVLAACLSVALASLIGMWLLTVHRSVAVWRLTDPSGSYEIDLRSYNERQKFPRRDDHSTELTIDGGKSFGNLVIGFRGWSWIDLEPAPGKSSAKWRRLTIDSDDDVPTVEQIADEITKAVDGIPTPLASQQAAWLHQQIVLLRSQPPNNVGLTIAPNLFTSYGTGSGSGSGLSRLGSVVLFLALGISVLLTFVLVWRHHKPGWRTAIEGEWQSATGTAAPAAQQSG